MGLVARLVHDQVVTEHRDRVCLIDETVGEVTYERLAEAVLTYSARLRATGFAPGDRGLVLSDDSVQMVLAFLALWANGCVPVPVSPMLTDEEIAFIAADSSATVVHYGVSDGRREALRPALGHLPATTAEEATAALNGGHGAAVASFGETEDADDEVLLQYTSGSTGRPKGVRQSLGGLLAVIDGFGRRIPLFPDDLVLSTAKLSFGYGFGSSLLWPLAAGAASVLLTGPVDVHRLIATLRLRRPTVLCTVPRMYALLAEHTRDRRDLASVRLGLSAGEHLPVGLRQRVTRAFGISLVDALGATEVGHIVLVTEDSADYGAVPVPGVTATVRDEHGVPVPAGETGRLHIAGPSVALGYLNRPTEQDRVFADGGVYLGDLARRTLEGHLDYLSRADDLLNLGGYKVAPTDIEAAVAAVKGVAGCAVVADTDGQGLTQAVAYVVPTEGTTPDELRHAVGVALRRSLAAYKRPSRVEVVDELPTTSTGKLARYKLRDQEGQR